jgi:hypothetical protein
VHCTAIQQEATPHHMLHMYHQTESLILLKLLLMFKNVAV